MSSKDAFDAKNIDGRDIDSDVRKALYAKAATATSGWDPNPVQVNGHPYHVSLFTGQEWRDIDLFRWLAKIAPGAEHEMAGWTMLVTPGPKPESVTRKLALASSAAAHLAAQHLARSDARAGDEEAPGHFQFIELKVASDTPLFAAVEVIAYGCAWLLSRRAAWAHVSAVLNAKRVETIVLAPDNYYARFNLRGVGARLDQELLTLGQTQGVEMRFGFEAFFDGLASPPVSEAAATQILARRRAL